MSEELAIESLPAAGNAEIAFENLNELITPLRALDDIRRYEQPEETTAFPLEYAFHLMNDVCGRTIIDLGCGSGLNTVILARLGARVVAIDSADFNLTRTERRAHANGVGSRVTLIQSEACAIPVDDGCTDRVLCYDVMQYTDPMLIARQIRRVLKPGGRAVFLQMGAPALLHALKSMINGEGTKDRAPSMSKNYARRLSRAVGLTGRLKEFWLTTGLLRFARIDNSSLARVSQRLDAALFRRFPSTRSLASSFVWEALKES